MIGVWSVANAATYVKRFLLANKADGVTYRFPDVSGAMAEVDSTLRTAAAAGDEDADLACRCLADIYDKVVLDEIDESDQPDGDLFRKGDVEIQGPQGWSFWFWIGALGCGCRVRHV